jgi:beta-lactamase regulating signal transducer with metallopeptidase domain
MDPQTQLALVATVSGFLLKTSLGFCFCWVVSKVVTSPNGRFPVWFLFLAASTFYWVWLALGWLPHGPAPIATTLPVPFHPAAPLRSWEISSSWNLPLFYVWRGLGVLYLVALAYLALARVRKQLYLRSMLRFAYEGPDDIEHVFHSMARARHLSGVQMAVLPGISSPATFGWLRPMVLLPPFCLEEDHRADLDVIFRHELQHIRRRDFALQNIASLCHALIFFHPAAWYALRQLKLESELACDLAVIGNSAERRATYAECLVRFARLNVANEAESWNLDFAGSSFPLKTRIRLILSETQKIPRWSLAARAALGLLLLAGFITAAPALFVTLSYERLAVSEQVKQLVADPTVLVRQRKEPVRLNYFGNPTLAHSQAEITQLPGPDSGNQPAPESSVDREPSINPSTSSGPTLKRRSATAAASQDRSVQDTVLPISGPDVGSVGGPGAVSRALNATANAVANGLGDKDKH